MCPLPMLGLDVTLDEYAVEKGWAIYFSTLKPSREAGLD